MLTPKRKQFRNYKIKQQQYPACLDTSWQDNKAIDKREATVRPCGTVIVNMWNVTVEWHS